MLVRNTGRYALAFRYTDAKGREKKIEFDRRRVFRDTGNIATTGITELDDKLHEKLMEDARYKKLFETGEFAIVSEEDLVVDNSSKELLKEKDKEIEQLKKQLEEQKKNTEPDEETKKALKNKDDEIKSLKERLEALGADDNDTKATDGF
jgi:hypothetical protein